MELTIPAKFDYLFQSANPIPGFAVDEADAGLWIPYEAGASNRFLMFDLNANSFALILRCEPGTVIDRHHHTGAVVGYCLAGSFKYKESDWIARPGTFIYERPGETHTFQVVGEETLVSFFHIMGPYIMLDENNKQIDYLDAFRVLEYCRRFYRENGLDPSYLDKITR